MLDPLQDLFGERMGGLLFLPALCGECTAILLTFQFAAPINSKYFILLCICRRSVLGSWYFSCIGYVQIQTNCLLTLLLFDLNI